MRRGFGMSLLAPEQRDAARAGSVPTASALSDVRHQRRLPPCLVPEARAAGTGTVVMDVWWLSPMKIFRARREREGMDISRCAVVRETAAAPILIADDGRGAVDRARNRPPSAVRVRREPSRQQGSIVRMEVSTGIVNRLSTD
jgi:hypothetical protein